MRLPAKAARFAAVHTLEELKELFEDPQLATLERFVLGGGSNIVISKDFPGLVIAMCIGGIELVDENDSFRFVRAGAGLNWDGFVSETVERGWWGLENLAGVPGTVGGAAVQNIGAYGVEAAERIVEVECFDPKTRRMTVLAAADCDYGYRTSFFKSEEGRDLIVTSVLFALPKAFEPVCGYKELEARFKDKQPATAAELAQAVREIRARKLPDPAVLPNAGSFFKNPVVTRAKLISLLEEAPQLVSYPLGGGRAKLAAGWLIDACGMKGKSVGGAAVYEKQALVIVNTGNATAQDVLSLAEEVTSRVRMRFGVKLEPEPVIV